MTFSNSFSASFNKVPTEYPQNIGELLEEYFDTFGQQSIAELAEDFTEAIGEWDLGDFPV